MPHRGYHAPGAHEGRTTLPGFRVTTIDDLDEAGIDGFLMQWCRWLKRGDGAAAQAYYAELRPAVAAAGIRHLVRNPLMLTSLAVLHFRRHRLPEQRVKLYEQILDWLAEQAADRHREHTKDSLLERFGQLALGMQEWTMILPEGCDPLLGRKIQINMRYVRPVFGKCLNGFFSGRGYCRKFHVGLELNQKPKTFAG